jgi:phytoene dehydrogenase-like protein
MRDTSSNQVVVLGASMAGLLAARVLSERFERVVVIERDGLPPIGEHRRGVPHGRHLHGLHPRGREILDELFPGFTGHRRRRLLVQPGLRAEHPDPPVRIANGMGADSRTDRCLCNETGGPRLGARQRRQSRL